MYVFVLAAFVRQTVAFALGDEGLEIGGGRAVRRARRERDVSAGGFDFLFERIAEFRATLDQFCEAIGIEVDVGDGGEESLAGEDVDFVVVDACFSGLEGRAFVSRRSFKR